MNYSCIRLFEIVLFLDFLRIPSLNDIFLKKSFLAKFKILYVVLLHVKGLGVIFLLSRAEINSKTSRTDEDYNQKKS